VPIQCEFNFLLPGPAALAPPDKFLQLTEYLPGCQTLKSRNDEGRPAEESPPPRVFMVWIDLSPKFVQRFIRIRAPCPCLPGPWDAHCCQFRGMIPDPILAQLLCCEAFRGRAAILFICFRVQFSLFLLARSAGDSIP
jgi:hypothetical protein